LITLGQPVASSGCRVFSLQWKLPRKEAVMSHPNTLRLNVSIPFTQIPNALLNDSVLSFKAKGIFSYLLSKPDGWQFFTADIEKHGKEGRDAILSGLHELEEHGYLKREQLNENGRFGNTVFHLQFPENALIRERETRIRKTRSRSCILNNTDSSNKKTHKCVKKSGPSLEKVCSFVLKQWNELASKNNWPCIRSIQGARRAMVQARLHRLRSKAEWIEFFSALESHCSELDWCTFDKMLSSDRRIDQVMEDEWKWVREQKHKKEPGKSREGYNERGKVNNLGLLYSAVIQKRWVTNSAGERIDHFNNVVDTATGLRQTEDGKFVNYFGIEVLPNGKCENGYFDLAQYDVDQLIEWADMKGRVQWDRKAWESRYGKNTLKPFAE